MCTDKCPECGGTVCAAPVEDVQKLYETFHQSAYFAEDLLEQSKLGLVDGGIIYTAHCFNCGLDGINPVQETHIQHIMGDDSTESVEEVTNVHGSLPALPQTNTF